VPMQQLFVTECISVSKVFYANLYVGSHSTYDSLLTGGINGWDAFIAASDCLMYED